MGELKLVDTPSFQDFNRKRTTNTPKRERKPLDSEVGRSWILKSSESGLSKNDRSQSQLGPTPDLIVRLLRENSLRSQADGTFLFVLDSLARAGLWLLSIFFIQILVHSILHHFLAHFFNRIRRLQCLALRLKLTNFTLAPEFPVTWSSGLFVVGDEDSRGRFIERPFSERKKIRESFKKKSCNLYWTANSVLFS